MSEIEKKVEVTQTETKQYCDVCGKEAIAFSRRVRKCSICSTDVCPECAIVTDHRCLEQGEFMGDYPSHYCEVCWEKGKEFREAILATRETENLLWDNWKQKCKKPEPTY